VTGIAGVQARVAAIESRFDAAFATAAEPATTTSGTGATTASVDDFAGVLSQALLQDDTGVPSSGGTGLSPAVGTCRCCCCSASGVAGLTASTGTAAPLGPAVKRATGDYGKLEPPAELVAYGNGRIPAQALEPIGVGDHRLWAPAAASFRQLRADAAAAGVQIGVTDSYRDYGTQVSLAQRKGLYSQGGLAASPGSSNHGWGMALDLDLDSTAQAWMRENAWRYGFVEDTPREPWHWGYRPASRST
jgi:hypothetical protein